MSSRGLDVTVSCQKVNWDESLSIGAKDNVFESKVTDPSKVFKESDFVDGKTKTKGEETRIENEEYIRVMSGAESVLSSDNDQRSTSTKSSI